MNKYFFGLAAGLVLISALAAGQDEMCEPLLTNRADILRHFRNAPDFQETRTGTWIQRNGRMIFVADATGISITTPIVNSSAHLEIIRRQVGDERFRQIMSSPSRDKDLADAMNGVAEQREDPALVLDAEKIHDEIEQYRFDADLPENLEKMALRKLKFMERFASPMTPWLRPKVLNKRIAQLGQVWFDDPISKQVSKTVALYKAVLVKVHLKDTHQFIFSSGTSTFADMTHSELHGTLEIVIPRNRRRDSIPGYIMVRADDETMMKGRVDFIRKGDKTVMFSEVYDFTDGR